MTSNSSAFWFSQLLQLPSLLVYLTGITLSIMFWNRHRSVSALSLSAFVVLLVNLVLGAWQQAWIMSAHERGSSADEIHRFITGLSGVHIVLGTAAWSLVLVALFGWRTDGGSPSPTPRSASVPIAAASDNRLAGIRGWLVLPAIGLVATPIVMLAGLIYSLVMLPELAATAGGAFMAMFVVNVMTGFVFMGLVVYAAVRFFGKKSNAPRVIVWMLIAAVAVSAALLVVDLIAGVEALVAEQGKALLISVVKAAIWIPYFRVSKRVKATFITATT